MNVELVPLTEEHLDSILPMIAAYHEFEHIGSTAAERESAVRKLLANPGFGAVWLIACDGEAAGYIVLCFGFSIEFDGFDAFVDEFFLVPAFRRRGIGARALQLIRDEARRRDIGALHLEVARDNEPARRLYRRAGFEARDKYLLMSATL